MKKKSHMCIAQGLATSVLALCAWSAQAANMVGAQLTLVSTTNLLNTTVENNSEQQIYDDTAFGTFVAVNDGTAQASWPLYGPADVPAGQSVTNATGYTPFTAGTQPANTGTGTTANPFTSTTANVGAGSDIQITQRDRLVDADEFYQTDITLTNTSDSAKEVILYRAMDCYLGADDHGFGLLTGNSVGCVRRDTAAQPNNTTDPTSPISRVEMFQPITPGAKVELNFYDGIWQTIGDRREYTGTCVPNCDTHQDNAIGISWRTHIPAGASVTFSHLTLFSPTGNIPPTTGVTPVPVNNPLALLLAAAGICVFTARRRRTA